MTIRHIYIFSTFIGLTIASCGQETSSQLESTPESNFPKNLKEVDNTYRFPVEARYFIKFQDKLILTPSDQLSNKLVRFALQFQADDENMMVASFAAIKQGKIVDVGDNINDLRGYTFIVIRALTKDVPMEIAKNGSDLIQFEKHRDIPTLSLMAVGLEIKNDRFTGGTATAQDRRMDFFCVYSKSSSGRLP